MSIDLSDLDTRYHDMLRELRRWGITESDGGGGSRPALGKQRIEKPTVHGDRKTSLVAADQMAGVAPGPSELIASDTTEQKAA